MGNKFCGLKNKVKSFIEKKGLDTKAKKAVESTIAQGKKIKENGFTLKQTVIISSILVLCLVIVLWPTSRVESPLQAVSKLEQAVLQGNKDEVVKFMQVRTIAKQVSTSILKQMNNQKVTADLLSYMHAELENKAINDFYRIVENKGSFYKNLERPDAIISKTLNFLVDKSGEVLSRKVISQDETTALIRLTVFRPDLDVEIPVDLEFNYKEPNWILAKIANLDALLTQLEEVEQTRVNKLNAQIRENFNNVLVLKEFQKSQLNVKENSFLMRLSLENISKENIKEVEGTLKLIYLNQLIGTVDIKIPETIYAQNFYEKAWSIKLNDYKSLQRLAQAKSENIRAVLDIEKIVFEKGNVIKLLK